MSRYSLEGYINKLRTTSHPYVLVEGTTDKRAIELLVRSLGLVDRNIQVESAEIIDSPSDDTLGNRFKVEKVCQLYRTHHPSERKLAGLVDREGRGFEVSNKCVVDRIGTTHIEDELIVWTRGHSTENYWLDRDLLITSLQSHLPFKADYSKTAAKFALVLDSVIRIALALSLVADGMNRPLCIAQSILWEHIRIDDDEANLDITALAASLVTHGLPQKQAKDIAESYPRALQIARQTTGDVARWRCHGHITLKVIWAAFASCVAACGSRKDGNCVFKTDEDTRVRELIGHWVTDRFLHRSEPPYMVFSVLGIDIEEPTVTQHDDLRAAR